MRTLLLTLLACSPAFAEDVDEQNRLSAQGFALVNPYIELSDRKAQPVDRDKLDRGLTILERVVTLNPRNASAYWFLGMGYRAEKDWQRSYERLRRAHALKPDNSDMAREFAAACLLLGRGEEAVQMARQAIAAGPNDAGLQANLALALLIAGRIDEALTEAKKAQARAPEDRVTAALITVIESVKAGKRPRPHNLRELEGR